MRDRIWTLLESSVLMQWTLAMLIVGVWLYLIIAGRATPELLDQLVGLVVGVFIGSKAQQMVAQSQRAALAPPAPAKEA